MDGYSDRGIPWSTGVLRAPRRVPSSPKRFCGGCIEGCARSCSAERCTAGQRSRSCLRGRTRSYEYQAAWRSAETNMQYAKRASAIPATTSRMHDPKGRLSVRAKLFTRASRGAPVTASGQGAQICWGLWLKSEPKSSGALTRWLEGDFATAIVPMRGLCVRVIPNDLEPDFEPVSSEASFVRAAPLLPAASNCREDLGKRTKRPSSGARRCRMSSGYPTGAIA
jgi:hypothetical protein